MKEHVFLPMIVATRLFLVFVKCTEMKKYKVSRVNT